MASKSKRLVTGAVLGGGSFIFRIFISLFMTPFMITSFGDHTYGLWMLIGTMSGFYGILDLGLSTAVQRYMAKSVGSGDAEEANTIFNTSLLVFSAIGFVPMILAGTLAWLAPLFVKNAADVSVFRLVLLFSSVNIIIGFPMRSFWGILSANLRYDISIYLDMVNVAVKTLLIIVFLKYGFGIIALALINLITDMLWNAANVIFALRIAPYIRLSKRYFSVGKLKTFFNYSVYVFVSRIADLIKYNIDNYVISAVIGLSAVTVYTVGTRLIMYTNKFLQKLIGLMTPVFSQYEGQGDFKSIKKHFFFIFKIGTYISVFFGGLLVMLSRPFIQRWVGAGYEEANSIILIFVIPTVFGMIMLPSNQLLYGISKHKFLSYVNTGEAVTNLVLSLIFVRFWGIKGVALGTAIPMIVTKLFIQPIYTARVLEVNPLSLYVKMILAVIKSSVILVTLYFLIKNLIGVSFIRIIAFGVTQSLCYAVLMFHLGLTRVEKEQLIKAFMPGWIRKGRIGHNLRRK